jgi:3-hydroxypropanoate dehydrogenase
MQTTIEPEELTTVRGALSPESIAHLFTDARTYHAWQPREVEDSLLEQIYEIGKWGPTALNSNPARLVFLKSESAKAKLLPALWEGNPDQVRQAPVTVIVAQDENFPAFLPRLFPPFDPTALFESRKGFKETAGFRDTTLQGAYFLLVARSLGLDVCPMTGLSNEVVDEAFFAGTSWKTNFIFTVGYGDATRLHPRGPRFSFYEACRIA